jgi:hypothetical protein
VRRKFGGVEVWRCESVEVEEVEKFENGRAVESSTQPRRRRHTPSEGIHPFTCHPKFSYTSGGLAFSYCFGAACGADLAEQGVFGPFCALKKDNKPNKMEVDDLEV